MEYISALDVRVLEALYAIRDPNLTHAFIWISEFGRSVTVFGLSFCVVLALLSRRHYAYAAGLAIATGSAGILILLLKGLVERARPAAEFQTYLEIWYSFPSAHAALATTLYGFLAYLAWRMIRNVPLRILAVTLCILLIFLISFSRLYLGVHYASDVVTGLLLGTACGGLGIWYAQFVRNS